MGGGNGTNGGCCPRKRRNGSQTITRTSASLVRPTVHLRTAETEPPRPRRHKPSGAPGIAVILSCCARLGFRCACPASTRRFRTRSHAEAPALRPQTDMCVYLRLSAVSVSVSLATLLALDAISLCMASEYCVGSSQLMKNLHQEARGTVCSLALGSVWLKSFAVD